LPSFPVASTISSSSRFAVEGVFRQSGVVHSVKVDDPILFVFIFIFWQNPLRCVLTNSYNVLHTVSKQQYQYSDIMLKIRSHYGYMFRPWTVTFRPIKNIFKVH
jgi:hypothetical protein